MKGLLFCTVVWLSSIASAGTDLFLFGGGTRPPEALKEFVAASGESRGAIMVVTWASNIPEDVFAAIAADLQSAGAAHIFVSLKPPVSPREKSAFESMLREATAIFFSGGDQSRAVAAIRRTGYKRTFINFYRSGKPIAGTSAGTAMMSPVMMTGDTTPLATGLGLLPKVLLDTHFLKRHREVRLEQALHLHPELLGVGIDEGGVLRVVDNRHAQIIGPEAVEFIKSEKNGTGAELLRQGECYSLVTPSPEPCR